jgi:SAM-dependent methyltransferase
MIDKEIDSFYHTSSENDRLKFGLGPLEFERNKELIERHIPHSASVILDIGGGPGIYSEWLAKLGHEVHLVDPVEKHIQQAEKKSSKLKNPFKTYKVAAGNLPFPESFADLIIFHGPLYHLQDKKERINVMKEAEKLMKPGGIFLGFAISYTASTLVGLLQGNLLHPGLFEMCREELLTHKHNAPADIPGIMPHAYYHSPQELKSEVTEAGLNISGIFAVEGMIWLDSDYFKNRADSEKKVKMMEILHLTENMEDLLTFSPHMMIAATKKSK